MFESAYTHPGRKPSKLNDDLQTIMLGGSAKRPICMCDIGELEPVCDKFVGLDPTRVDERNKLCCGHRIDETCSQGYEKHQEQLVYDTKG